MSFSKDIVVRGFHCDAYGHVNNARYLEFLEEARWDALVEADVLKEFEARGLQFFIVNIDINFRKPVTPGMIIQVKTSLHECQRRTITFLQELYNGDQKTTEAKVTFVLFDTAVGKATNVSEEIKNLFTSFA
jgi:thioesterase-3